MSERHTFFRFEIEISCFCQAASWELVGNQFRGTEEEGFHKHILDALDVRERFLQAKTDAELLEWLNSTGILHEELMTISRDDLRKLQRVVVTRLTDNPVFWYDLALEQPFSDDPLFALFDKSAVHLDLLIERSHEGEPFGVVDVSTTLQAIAVGVVLDRARGSNSKYALCTFERCPRTPIFKVKSGHGAKYCSPECAKADGERRRRAQKKPVTAK
jgi:hypothetical protein